MKNAAAAAHSNTITSHGLIAHLKLSGSSTTRMVIASNTPRHSRNSQCGRPPGSSDASSFHALELANISTHAVHSSSTVFARIKGPRIMARSIPEREDHLG